MGLSSFSTTAAEGVLPVLVMNTVLYVVLLKNLVRSLLQVMGADRTGSDYEENPDGFTEEHVGRERRISTTLFKALCFNDGVNDSSSTGGGSTSSSSSRSGKASTNSTVECCVCLCGFEAEEEVSELSCKHFFHKNCLDKWFGNKHSTCPLCRSVH